MELVERIYIPDWKDAYKWQIPVKLFLNFDVPKGWKKVALKKLLAKVENKVKVEPEQSYKLAGVKWYGEGIFHRETQMGNEISASWLSPLVEGAFIYNRLFAWKESFAVVTKEHRDLFVSNEFPQFLLDSSEIIPEYLQLFFLQTKIIKAVNKASAGSAAVSRNRFKEEDFLEFEILLPPLAEQDELIKKRNGLLALKNQIRSWIDSYSENLNKIIFDTLDISIARHETIKGPLVVDYKNLQRWDVFYFSSEHGEIVSKIPLVRLGKYADIISVQETPDKHMPCYYVGLENIASDTGNYELVTTQPGEIKSNSAVLQQGLIYYSKLRPYLNKCVLFESSQHPVYGSNELVGIKGKGEISIEYLQLILLSDIVKSQVSRLMIGARMPRISQDDILNFMIVVPPKSHQQKIIEKVNLLKDEVKRRMSEIDEINTKLSLLLSDYL